MQMVSFLLEMFDDSLDILNQSKKICELKFSENIYFL